MSSPPVSVRPMALGDVPGAAAVFLEAITAVYAPAGSAPPDEAAAAENHDRLSMRMAHMLGTDPAGAWVAVAGDEVVGLAQAIVRDDLWILSLLGVAPGHQDGGAGRALLEQALGHGDRLAPGLIFSSPDPRAMRRYLAAGFDLHPCVAASGVPVVAPGAAAAVREGGPGDRPLVDAVDRHLRGAPHGVDVDYLLGQGARLLVADEGAYAILNGTRLMVLGAMEDAAARSMLRGAFAAMVDAAGEADGSRADEMSVDWLTAGQQWALDECTKAGLSLRAAGSVMVRGRPGPLAPYVPSGGFG